MNATSKGIPCTIAKRTTQRNNQQSQTQPMYTKLLRFTKARVAYELDGIIALAQYPFRKKELITRLAASCPSINIETTNICNASCTFCVYQYMERPRGTMNMPLFKKIVDEFCDCGGGELNMTPNVGEPLCDRHLLERIAYARSKKEITSIGFYSNMIGRPNFDVRDLVHSGLGCLIVSTSGLDAEMFSRVYRSNKYSTVLANIKAFATANNLAGRPVNFQVTMRADRPLREVFAYPDCREVAALVGDENLSAALRFGTWGGKIKPSQLTGTMRVKRLRRPRLTCCAQMFAGPMVYWDGRVGVCSCQDYEASDLVIGDITTHHLADIWFGEATKALRSEFMTAKRRPICEKCDFYGCLSAFLRPTRRIAFQSIRPSKYSAPV